jgi:hypothetical protein
MEQHEQIGFYFLGEAINILRLQGPEDFNMKTHNG